ncbi:MAG: hypothetical protein SVT52_06750 [Planctomycetota bacterium]|nr:hypothetical protein [Planctomycetota bacterium]
MNKLALTAVLAWAVVAGGVFAAGDHKADESANERPKIPPTVRPPEDQKIVKYRPATPKQIEANHKLAKQWAEKVRQDIAPKMHLVETEHFLIFSEWALDDDKSLADVCEKMYAAMCRQFGIPAKQNIWAGKCPIYLFRNIGHFRRFTTEVDQADRPEAAGYQRQYSNGFCYIVINAVRNKIQFYGILVHEATHAFLGRYLTNRPVSTWVNEGLAEYMAAMQVPGSWASQRHIYAARVAAKGRADVMRIFQDMEPTELDYGLAQSLVRFMIARDRKAFVKFVKLIKEGESEAEALKKSYRTTHAGLARAWTQAVERMYKLRR